MSSRRIGSRPRLPRRSRNRQHGSPDAACIDLTRDRDVEVIDLTSQMNNSMGSPVVILNAMYEVDSQTPSANRRQRGSGRRGVHRSRSSRRRLARIELPTSPPVSAPSSSTRIELDNSEDEELPDIPFDIPQKSKEANASFVKSPPLSISCPICLDDLKQLKSDKKKIMSTVCGHIFCQDCIKGAISRQKACPTCRKTLKPSMIHPLFL